MTLPVFKVSERVFHSYQRKKTHTQALPNYSFYFLLFIVFSSINTIYAKNSTDAQPNIVSKLTYANTILNSKPDSALVLYKELLPILQKTKASKQIIECHVGICDIYKNRGHYSKAYDHIWEALLIGEKTQDTLSLAIVHKDIGGLYNIFEKHDEAIIHFQKSLSFIKDKFIKSNKTKLTLNSIYFSLAIANRKAKRFKKALTYLDSCYSSKKQINHAIFFLYAQKGRIYLDMKKPNEAESYLKKAHKHFHNQNLSYKIITSLNLGDFYFQQENWAKAKQFYTYSLNALLKEKKHGDRKVEILKKLSLSHKKLGSLNIAYQYLEKSFAISDSLFNTRTTINNELFQINNKYEKAIQEKNEFIKNQTTIIEKDRILQSRLKLTILFIVFIIIAGLSLVYMRKKLKKLRYEKQQQKLKNQQEKEETNEILNVKSRQLTANTLQIIEKDHTINELLEELKKNTSKPSKLNPTIVKNKKNMWDEFNKRFIEVNPKFYHRLREKHPELTPTELKHCALIKLNFDSKEMASILNISLSSVHISRHRIRKKIKLERSHNLSNYITDI